MSAAMAAGAHMAGEWDEEAGSEESGAWDRLIQRVARKRRTAVYRITLVVRGRTIVKEYSREDDYRKWKQAYEQQLRHSAVSGVEHMTTDVFGGGGHSGHGGRDGGRG